MPVAARAGRQLIRQLRRLPLPDLPAGVGASLPVARLPALLVSLLSRNFRTAGGTGSARLGASAAATQAGSRQVSAVAGRLGRPSGPPAMSLGGRPGVGRAPVSRPHIRGGSFSPRGRLPLILLTRRPGRTWTGLALIRSTTRPGGVLTLLRLPWQTVRIPIGLTVSRSQSNFELDDFIPLRVAAIALGDGE